MSRIRTGRNSPRGTLRPCLVPWGAGSRPEFRLWVQRPTPEFQLMFGQVVTTDDELKALARQQRQLFEAQGWAQDQTPQTTRATANSRVRTFTVEASRTGSGRCWGPVDAQSELTGLTPSQCVTSRTLSPVGNASAECGLYRCGAAAQTSTAEPSTEDREQRVDGTERAVEAGRGMGRHRANAVRNPAASDSQAIRRVLRLRRLRAVGGCRKGERSQRVIRRPVAARRGCAAARSWRWNGATWI